MALGTRLLKGAFFTVFLRPVVGWLDNDLGHLSNGALELDKNTKRASLFLQSQVQFVSFFAIL